MSETAPHDQVQNGGANGVAPTPPPPPATLPGEDAAHARFAAPRLPWHPAIEERYGIKRGEWKVLVEATFPAAKSADAVVMVLAYCQARKLDPFKKPVHIVPVWDSRAGPDGEGGYIETVWPSISELRTTAFRTSQYAGCDPTEFGPLKTQKFQGRAKIKGQWQDIEKTVTFPEWAQVTVTRVLNGVERRFAGPKVYWLETYAKQGASDVPNDMWTRRASGQIEKCAEAGALRKAFPEELGNEYSAEEMEGQRLFHEMRDVTPKQPALAPPAPPGGLRPPPPPSNNLAPPPPPPQNTNPASGVAGEASQSPRGPAAGAGSPRSENAVGTGSQEPPSERGDSPSAEEAIEKLAKDLKACQSLDHQEGVWVAFEGEWKTTDGKLLNSMSKVQWERAKGVYFDAQQRFHD